MKRRNPYTDDSGGGADPAAALFIVAVFILGLMVAAGLVRSCTGPGPLLHQAATGGRP